MDELDLTFAVTDEDAIGYYELINTVRTMMMCGKGSVFREVNTINFNKDKTGERGMEFLCTTDICSMDVLPRNPRMSRSNTYVKVGNVHLLDTVLTEAGLGYLLVPLRREVNRYLGSW